MSVFWKPGTSGPGGSERGDDSAQPIDPKLSKLPLDTQRKSLPIYRHRNSVLFALHKHRTVVIVGETGCGKTTQVSPRMLRASWCAGMSPIILYHVVSLCSAEYRGPAVHCLLPFVHDVDSQPVPVDTLVVATGMSSIISLQPVPLSRKHATTTNLSSR